MLTHEVRRWSQHGTGARVILFADGLLTHARTATERPRAVRCHATPDDAFAYVAALPGRWKLIQVNGGGRPLTTRNRLRDPSPDAIVVEAGPPRETDALRAARIAVYEQQAEAGLRLDVQRAIRTSVGLPIPADAPPLVPAPLQEGEKKRTPRGVETQVRQLRARGLSVPNIARLTGLGVSTVERVLRRERKEGAA